MNRHLNVRVQFCDEDAALIDLICDVPTAIAHLQAAIVKLRRPDTEQRDHSFGASPLPIIGPSQEELAEFLRAQGIRPLPEQTAS